MFETPPTDRTAPPLQKESVRQYSMAIFRSGAELLAVDASAVQEITYMARLSTPAGLPSVLAGFLNLAGRPIPILRLPRLLELPEPESGLYTQILILRCLDGSSVGWIVDRVVQVAVVREVEIMPVPESQCFRDCTAGVFTLNDAPVSIIAPDRLLLVKERLRIDEFRNMERERLRQLESPGS